MEKLKPHNADSYIAKADIEAQSILNEIRSLIKLTIPKAEEGISYSVPFYQYYGEFVGFAAYKSHISFGFGANVLSGDERKLLERKGYVLGKGTMQIKFGQNVPREEIRNILLKKAKMNENK